MSDRLALSSAIEDAGIERAKATHIASVIFDALHQHVAAKADVQASEATLRSEMAALRADLQGGFAQMDSRFAQAVTGLRGEAQSGFAQMDGKFAREDVAMERLRSTVREMEGRMVLRLGGWLAVLFGLFFAALHAWPPH